MNNQRAINESATLPIKVKQKTVIYLRSSSYSRPSQNKRRKLQKQRKLNLNERTSLQFFSKPSSLKTENSPKKTDVKLSHQESCGASLEWLSLAWECHIARNIKAKRRDALKITQKEKAKSLRQKLKLEEWDLNTKSEIKINEELHYSRKWEIDLRSYWGVKSLLRLLETVCECYSKSSKYILNGTWIKANDDSSSAISLKSMSNAAHCYRQRNSR